MSESPSGKVHFCLCFIFCYLLEIFRLELFDHLSFLKSELFSMIFTSLLLITTGFAFYNG